MDFQHLAIPGCMWIAPRIFEDTRGVFVKTFSEEIFQAQGLYTRYAEEFYSVSKYGALRGLHFQTPPYDHVKVVTCIEGEVLDVILDLRRGSPMYGRAISLPLNAKTADGIYIPKGCAHGFVTLSELSIMLYKTSTGHMPTHDMGILWRIADVAWPIAEPTLSERDKLWPTLAEFVTPFVYEETFYE